MVCTENGDAREGKNPPGHLMILLGSYHLLTGLGLGRPEWRILWSVLPLTGGVAVRAATILDEERGPGLVFLSTATLLASLAFLFITRGFLTDLSLSAWRRRRALISEASFIAPWMAGGFSYWDVISPGLMALCVAGVAVAMTRELLRPNTRGILLSLWLVLPILGRQMALPRGVRAGHSP